MTVRERKERLVEAFRAHLLELRASLLRGLEDARQGMRVSGDDRPRNRGERASVTSQGYLAEVLNQRRAELDEALELLPLVDLSPAERARAGALVVLERAGRVQRYFLLPGGDGTRLEVDGERVVALSPTSPLGRALLGLEAGEELEEGGELLEVD